MTNKAHGIINGQGPEITGNFRVDGDLIVAKIHLTTPVTPFEGPDATLEYDNIGDLHGPFKIDPDSVIGPEKLYLLLKNESGVTATIRAHVLPPLPSGLHQGGTAIFIQPK